MPRGEPEISREHPLISLKSLAYGVPFISAVSAAVWIAVSPVPPSDELRSLIAIPGLCKNSGRLLPEQSPSAADQPKLSRRGMRFLKGLEHKGNSSTALYLKTWQLSDLDACRGRFSQALDRLGDLSSTRDPNVLRAAGISFLSRADRDSNPIELLKAIGSFRRGLEEEPENLALLTGYAEGLRQLGLIETRRRILNKLIQLETSPAWLANHQRHLLELEKKVAHYRIGEETFRDLRSVLREPNLRSRIQEYPYLARKLVEERLLGDWGVAWSAADFDTAKSILEVSKKIASALQEDSGDPLLELTTSSIEASRGPERRTLAEALAAFSEGMRIYRKQDRYPEEAIRRLEDSHLKLSSCGVAFASWAEHYSLVLKSFTERNETTTRWRELFSETPKDHLALRGHIAWRLGIERQMSNDAIAALPFFEMSIPLLERVSGHRGSAFGYVLIANTLADLGLLKESWTQRIKAINPILVSRDYWQRHSLLHGTAHGLVRSREPELALLILDELEANTIEWGFPTARAEFHFIKARAQAVMGAYDQAKTSVDLGREAIHDYTEGGIATWLREDADLAEGFALAVEDPKKALTLINRAHKSQENIDYLYETIPILSGLVKVTSKENRAASKDYRKRLLVELLRMRGDLKDPVDRSVAGTLLEKTVNSLLEQHPPLSDEDLLVVSDLIKPRPISNLSCGSFGALKTSGNRTAPLLTCIQDLLAPDEMVITYHHSHKDLFIGIIRSTRLTLHRQTLAVHKLGVLTRRYRDMLSQDRRNASLELGRVLYSTLLGAVDVSDIRRLIIIPDSKLLSVPFQSLPISKSGKPLILEFEVSFYPSLALLAASRSWPRGGAAAPSEATLLVASPSMAPFLSGSFQPLRFATKEIETIAGLYPEHRILKGREASVERVTNAMQQAPITHLAVHSVPGGPGSALKGLILAPDSPASNGVLTLDRFANVDLSASRLLVLSGCSSALGFQSGRAILWGLPAVALAAGAQAVLATTAPIDDYDASLFSIEFHRRFQKSGDATQAYTQTVRFFISEKAKKTESDSSVWIDYRLFGG